MRNLGACSAPPIPTWKRHLLQRQELLNLHIIDTNRALLCCCREKIGWLINSICAVVFTIIVIIVVTRYHYYYGWNSNYYSTGNRNVPY